MTIQRFDDRVRAWLLDRDPGEVPDTLRASAGRVPFEIRRPLLASFLERRPPVTQLETGFQGVLLSGRRLAPGAITLLLLIGLVVGLMLLGGEPQRLPAPYGPAANGWVAFARGGDILTVDPDSGKTTAIVTGPADDADPVWSLDGTRLVFRRSTADEAGDRLYVVGANGDGLVSLTPKAIPGIHDYSFSPDGRSVVFISSAGQILIADTGGRGVHALSTRNTQVCVSTQGCEPSFRPPDGKEILYVGAGNTGLYVATADGTGVRTLVAPVLNRSVIAPRWSPDGSKVAYAAWPHAPTLTVRTRVVDADGSRDLALEKPSDAVWDGRPVWSNDGTRIAIIRGYGPMFQRSVLAVVPADEGGRGIETKPMLLDGWDGIPDLEWSPDDSSILLTRYDGDGEPAQQVRIDPQTGEFEETEWGTESSPAWQRIAR